MQAYKNAYSTQHIKKQEFIRHLLTIKLHGTVKFLAFSKIPDFAFSGSKLAPNLPQALVMTEIVKSFDSKLGLSAVFCYPIFNFADTRLVVATVQNELSLTTGLHPGFNQSFGTLIF